MGPAGGRLIPIGTLCWDRDLQAQREVRTAAETEKHVCMHLCVRGERLWYICSLFVGAHQSTRAGVPMAEIGKIYSTPGKRDVMDTERMRTHRDSYILSVHAGV